jgi:hypothetical protein
LKNLTLLDRSQLHQTASAQPCRKLTIIGQVRKLARRAGELGDDGTNDLVVSALLRRNELQAWFLSEHLVDAPFVHAEPVHAK